VSLLGLILSRSPLHHGSGRGQEQERWRWTTSFTFFYYERFTEAIRESVLSENARS